MASDRRLIRVAVPVPLAEAFDYVWTGLSAPPSPGCRVRVPFGRGERIGVVVGHATTSALPADRLKCAGVALDARPVLDDNLLQTLLWAADYYHHPVGEVLTHALPGLLRKGRSLDGPTAARAADAATEPPADQRFEPGRVPELSTQQRRVLEAIATRDVGYEPYLLHGVTGSGKTEVYLRLIAEQLAAGRQTLLLVPEIGLTPQLVRRLRQRFGGELAVLHSGLTEKQRFDAWRRAHDDAVKLVVGTRSAVFAPLPNAGLIVVDEEHDASYKQQVGFRYSARDLAVLRARRLRIPIVLASATPSLESFHNALQGRYHFLTMPKRVGGADLPRMEIIDLGRHASRGALSTPLVARIERHLARGNQVLLFLNRRGYAPALFCPECKHVETCGRCDARLTVHARAGRLRCHHCGAEHALHWACEACGAERIAVGAGTQRVSDELKAAFPNARIARLDRDATSRKGTLAAVLDEIESGDTQILVGTQMLTKGHDFPRVTLVGVLNADQGLFGTDFRSHERLAQTVLQVAGRAGRRSAPGEVVIQTHYPEHPLLTCVLEQGYEAFARFALADRESALWPPFAHLAAWRAEAAQRPAAFAFLDRVGRLASEAAGGVRILGPAACAMERKDARYRAQLLFQCAQRGPLHALLTRTLLEVRRWPEARKLRWSVDVDPLEI
jgi:primosomal protein N' (replication factor Y)